MTDEIAAGFKAILAAFGITPELYKTIMATLGMSGIAAAVRTWVIEKERTFKSLVRAFFAASFVGIILAIMLREDPWLFAMVAVCGVAADYILLLFIKVVKALSEKEPEWWINLITKRFVK